MDILLAILGLTALALSVTGIWQASKKRHNLHLARILTTSGQCLGVIVLIGLAISIF